MERRSIYSKGRIVGIEQGGSVYWNDHAYDSLGTSLSALTGARVSSSGIDVGPPPIAGQAARPHIRPKESKTSLAWLVVAALAALAYALYWLVRGAIYGSGAIGLLAFAACAPLYLRVFLKPAALEYHRRVARAALWFTLVPVVSYGIASQFDMLANDVHGLPYSLGPVLAASALMTALVAAATEWGVHRAHLNLNRRHPDCPLGHGVGLVALVPHITQAWYTNWTLDIVLVAVSAAAFWKGGTANWIGATLAGAVVYTWACDLLHHDAKRKTGNASTDLKSPTLKRSTV